MSVEQVQPNGLVRQSLKGQSLAGLTLAAIGVVYGDIGTSPLYTVKEIFSPHTGLALNAANLIGAISAVFWALMMVVTLKYVILILRADNRGEGGSLALTALAADAEKRRPRLRQILLLLGVVGATMFYGDSIITPAISVIGAMEGLQVLEPKLQPVILPLALVVLTGLFLVQRWGTASVGRFFGPVIVLWFVTLGVAGLVNIVQAPAILQALNPFEAIAFLLARGPSLLLVVGAIVLALTGAEALYADMGHFGRKPIQIAWTALVFPGLALNYLGQGALLMADPTALENPFFRLFPDELLIPAVILATLAAIIASQAVISGAYSMTKQAILLGFLPRMEIRYTSASEAGQIYIPGVNWALLLGVLATALMFKTSSNMAAAYGVAVSLTMVITTFLTYFVVHDAWRLPRWLALGSTAIFLTMDLLLFAGCAIKFADGGWFPLVLGLILFTMMTTWAQGRQLLATAVRRDGLETRAFVKSLDHSDAHLVSRTAVYPVSHPETVPQALLHNMKHNQVLHETNVILTVEFQGVPWVPNTQRLVVERLSERFWMVTVRYGFMNTPDVPKALRRCKLEGLEFEEMATTYFLSRETVVPTPGGGMVKWREQLFAAMSHNASGVVEFFKIPDNAVVELGTRVQI